MAFKFPVINPLLHNELRLKIMVALDSLESANFMYLCEITGATRGYKRQAIYRWTRVAVVQPLAPYAASPIRGWKPYVPTNKVCVVSLGRKCQIWTAKEK